MPDALVDAVSGIVHEPTQTEGPGLDLTLADVHRVEAPGRVDFGGGELAAADLETVETERRNPGDDYGWWNLETGTYLVAYNESLAEDLEETYVVQTREEVRARGAFHPTLHAEALRPVPLTVGGAGIRLKENARISTLLAE